MTASLPAAPRRRLRWPWVLAALVLLPLFTLALGAVSLFTLDSPASTLRRSLAASSPDPLETRVQFSVGPVMLGGARLVLGFVQTPEVQRIRPVLASIRRASVGVYQTGNDAGGAGRLARFEETRATMAARGWHRLVGVVNDHDTVMIYTRENPPGKGPLDLCLAVRDGREVVVVSTSIDAETLAAWVASEAAGALAANVRLALNVPPAPGT